MSELLRIDRRACRMNPTHGNPGRLPAVAAVAVVAAVLWLALLLTAPGPAAASGMHVQAADFHSFSEPDDPREGAVVLTRSRRVVHADIQSADLDPDSAYTVWWVVFNRPWHCATSPCTGADLKNRAVRGANFYATGLLTDATGAGTARARLVAGRVAEGRDFIDQGTGVAPRLDRANGLKAELHLVLRTHGPIVAGAVAEQIGTGEFAGCAPCANQQAAVLPAVK